MSHFEPLEVACPECGARRTHSIAHTLNPARSPAACQEILNGSFQRYRCPECAAQYTIEEPFLFIDFARRVLVGVLPEAWSEEWRRWEPETGRRFREDTRPVRWVAEGFRVRTVFGHDALREKLLSWDAGWDDVTLEIFKLELRRERMLEAPSRLTRVEPDQLWLRVDGPDEVRELAFTRQSLEAIANARGPYSEVRAELAVDSYVDCGRFFG